MPIVYFHGVNTRFDRGYLSRVDVRDSLIRRLLGPALDLPEGFEIVDGYWGDLGASFRWNHASLPQSGEALGAQDDAELLLSQLDPVALGTDPTRIVSSLAALSLGEAVDLLFGAAGEHVDAASSDEFIAVVAGAAEWAIARDATTTEGDDGDFVQSLARQISARDEQEALGGAGVWDAVGEGLSRLRSFAPNVISHAVSRSLRSPLHESLATFVGDVLVYVAQTPAVDPEAPLVARVAERIEEATRRAGDEQVVILAHSLGGIISFDVLARHRPDLHCDTLVTVGSQVGLFAELGLLGVAQGFPEDPTLDRLPAPPGVDRWLNVYDRNDCLAFAASPIFDGVEDFSYSTGRGLMTAHSAYFSRPSFLVRLGRRLGDRS